MSEHEQVAEVLVEVGFADGRRAVFTVSPSGRLSPSQGDGVAPVAADVWVRAAALLAGHGLRPPTPGASVRTPGGIAWPWAEEEGGAR